MTPKLDIAVHGGSVVSHEGRRRTDLGIRNGRIVALADHLPSAEIDIEAEGLVVLPGLIDAHVHLREPGMTEKEGFYHGTRAAAAGGITTVFDMPNTLPPVATVEAFDEKLAIVAPKAHVDFALYGMLGQDNAGEILALADRGAAGLKLFMGQTTGDNPCPDDAAIFAGLRLAREAGLVVGAHAENDKVLKFLSSELRARGRTDPIAHLESRPSFVEEEAIGRFLTLACAAGTQVHIHHLSTAAGLSRLTAARQEGIDATGEVLVAHLLLDDTAYEEYGNLIKLNPPIRPASDVAALWSGLASGQLQVLASDHAPHQTEEQSVADVWEAPGGFIGVETLLPLMLTQVAQGRLSLEDLVRLAAWNPARIWRIADRKGHLEIGADADFNLVDIDAKGTIEAKRLHSRHRVTPYDGWPVQGAIRATYQRGNLIAKDGQATGTAGGAFLRPSRRPA